MIIDSINIMLFTRYRVKLKYDWSMMQVVTRKNMFPLDLSENVSFAHFSSFLWISQKDELSNLSVVIWTMDRSTYVPEFKFLFVLYGYA